MEQKNAQQNDSVPRVVLEPETERINVRVSETLKRDFTDAAAAHGLKLSAALKQLMIEYVNEWKKGGR